SDQGGLAAGQVALSFGHLLPAGHLRRRAGADLLPGVPATRQLQPPPDAAVTNSPRLIRADTGAVVVRTLEVADGLWSRFWGWQFGRSAAPGVGLLLVPCASVHTFFMRFAIDVLLLDRGGVVL